MLAAFLFLLLSAVLFADSPMQIVLPKTEVNTDTFKIEQQRNGLWTITTEHYDIITTHSAAAGIETGERLEHLYSAWKQLFYEALYGKEKAAVKTQQRLRVFVYKNKEDYVQNLKSSERGIEPMLRESHGFYHPRRQTAYFYPVSEDMDKATADSVHKTLYHEGTHQLFQEVNRKATLLPGARNNFWLAEGIAMVMETFQIKDDCYTVGDADDNRLYAAKTHRFDKKYFFYVPFADIVKMGREQFQTNPKLARLYSQSAGIAHFLMFYENSKYRPAMMELLRQIYGGSAKPESLSKLTGQPYETLDGEYETFLK
jgi:hypothetical protein